MAEPLTRILALDCATVTGWAWEVNGQVEYGRATFGPNLRPGERFAAFRAWLMSHLNGVTPNVVAVEGPISRHFSHDTARLAYGWNALVLVEAHLRDIPVREVSPTTLKKFATGKGTASKDAMKEAAVRRFLQGCHPDRMAGLDHNEADALLVLAWARAGFPA